MQYNTGGGRQITVDRGIKSRSEKRRLWMGEEVYCLVDLVYSEHWDHPVNSEVEIALTP